MKKAKWLVLTLVLVLLLGVFFACGKDDMEGGSKVAGAGAGTRWEDVDFSGTALKISISVEQYDNKATIPSSDRYIRGSDQNMSDTVLNMAFNRNEEVEDILGIKIYYQEVRHQYDDVQQYIEELVMAANSATPDIFIDDVFGSIRSAMSGKLYNVMDQDEENYFIFDEEHGWYTGYMDGLTFNPSVKYILAGDYFIDVLREAHVLFVNIDRYEEVIGDIEANLYADITAGLWTYDYLAELADLGWDPGPDNKTGSAMADDDVIGFAIDSIAVYPFLYGSNSNSLYTVEQGQYTVLYENPTYFTFASDIFNLLTAQAVYRTSELGNGTRTSTMFANGNVLIAEGMWLSDLENPEIRNMEDRKGIVVYPKQNAQTAGYNTYIHDIAEVGSIAMSTQKFSACTAYLACVNEFSGEFVNEYKQYAVKFKYNTDPATGAMIDLIYNTIGSPFEGIMGTLAFEQVSAYGNGVTTPKEALKSCVNGKNNTFVNVYQTSHNVYVSGINALMAKFR